MNIEKLKQLLQQYNVPASDYSINDPKNYCMNLSTDNGLYEVWFQDDGGRYSQQSYDNPEKAVYDFVTRLSSVETAHDICQQLFQ